MCSNVCFNLPFRKIVNESQEETLVEACSDADANCSSNLRIEGEKTNQNA